MKLKLKITSKIVFWTTFLNTRPKPLSTFSSMNIWLIICLKSLEILGISGLSPLQASLSPLPDRTVEKTGPVA